MYPILPWNIHRWLQLLNPWLWPWLCVVPHVHLVGMMVAMSDVLPVGVWLNLWDRCPNIWLFNCWLFLFWCLLSQWGTRKYSFPLFWWSVDDSLYLVSLVVGNRLSTLVHFFLNIWYWVGEYTHHVESGCIHGNRCVCLDSVRVLLSLYVECRDAWHFPQTFWLGLDCVDQSYLNIAVF